MASPEHMKSFAIRDVEEDVEVAIDKRNDDDWDGDDKRKHKSSKSRKMGSGEEVDGFDTSGRKRSTSDRHESRKRMSSSSRVDSDQDEYERKESHSKQMKKKSDEHAFYRSSSWHQDEDADHKLEGGDKAASRGYIRDEESDRKKSNSKYSELDFEANEAPIMDSRYSERRDGNKEKGYGYGEHGRRAQSRWDESETLGKEEKYVAKIDIKSAKSSFYKQESESSILEIESSDAKIKAVDIADDEGIGFQDGEDNRLKLDRNQKGKPEVLDEDTKGSSAREDRSGKDRFEEHRKQRNRSSRDIAYDNERSLNEEDTNVCMRDKYKRDIESPNMSRTPEKIGRQQYDSENFEMDYERNSSVRRKELGKDGSWDEKSKGRDDTWVEKDKNRNNFKDIPKRRQEKETRGGETTYDNTRDWELPRRGREWIDGEWSHGRPGGRKDGNRSIAVKTSSNYGISNENYDVIEINTKPFDYGRDDSSSTFARNSEVFQQSDAKPVNDVDELSYSRDERLRKEQGSGQSGEESKDRYFEGGSAMQDQNSWRDDEFQTERSRSQKGVMSSRGTGGQSSNSGSLPPHGNHENGYFNRNSSQGFRGNKVGRGGRGRFNGRDCQQSGIPLPLVGSPFVPPGMPPPGSMQSLTPNISPAPGLSVTPGVFIPPFQPPIMCPGARGVEMNMLVVQPGLPPVPPGPLAHRFSPNMVNPPNSAMMFNPMGPVRGTPPIMSGPNFNVIVPAVRGQLQDKASGGWVPHRSNGPPGKAPSRGEQNDYSQNFVDTGMRPQNFIRELELTSVVEDYPKLRDLIQRKDEIVSKSASPPMYYKCDLREQVLSQEFFGTKFDVILVDPPWEEYVHRAPGVTEHMEYWTLEEIMNLKIEAITDTPSFIFLWVADGVGLEQGRQCLKKWGFRRCEDICWVKTNKTNATPGLRHDSHTLFQRSKEHCLMGIKGTVRRSTDGHIIHANIDTDVIIAEEPPYGSTAKPEDMYRIIEHFSLGRRRLELFGEDHNIRSGWLTVGNGLSSSNFNSEAYVRNFSDKDGKVWVGVGGRNPPPEAPHLIQTTPEIESLRPKSPMKNQQQQSVSISLTTSNAGNKRPAGNSPQSHTVNQEVYSSNVPSPAPWTSPAEPFRGRESSHVPPDEPMFDMYGYNPSYVTGNGDGLDISSQGGMNMM